MDFGNWGDGDLTARERHAPHRAPPGKPGQGRSGGRHRYEDRVADDAPTDPAEQPAGGPESTDPTGRQEADTEYAAEPAERSHDSGSHVSESYGSEAAAGPGWPITDTGQWHITDTGEWSRGDLADLDAAADSDAEQHPYGPAETFWEGTRLAGDDPRWMPTPSSAPQSPAVHLEPLPVLPALPAPLAADTDPLAVRADPLARYPDHRRYDTDPGGTLAAVLCAAAWYVVPLLAMFGWMLTLDGSAPPGCLTDAAGRGCESERAEAAASIMAVTPQFGAAVGVSVVVAVLLRRVYRVWRAAAVGILAAVIGGGLSTILFQLITDQAR